MSQTFGRTLREAPADAEVASHQLLVRAGFVRQLAAGVFSALPLGLRSVRRLEAIIREEMDAIGGQELAMPVVHPAELWQATGRWQAIGPELGRLRDRGGRDLVLAMTHEEVVADLARTEVQSHRDLPRLVYQLQTKWRDDARPRAGLIRVREFTMLDSYSLDADEAGLAAQYAAHHRAYRRIFARCGLPVIDVEADVGMMGGNRSHEFMFLDPIGEDTIISCASCGYVANRQVAVLAAPPGRGAERPLERVATPGASTIEALAAQLGIEARDTAKALFLTATIAGAEADEERECLVLAVVRGDLDVAETKVANAVGARALRPARAEEIAAAGAVAGYASPVGLARGPHLRIVIDPTVAEAPALVGGANEAGYHLLGTRHGRDYVADAVVDIALARAGDACAVCGAPLGASRGVEVGNIFQLGTKYSAALGATFADENGALHPVIMGSYGIGVGRTLQSVAEAHRDDAGLCWPIALAPYDAHVVELRGGEAEAARLVAALEDAGLDVLHDDRDERPGVKFADADLIGVPLRVTVGGRSLEGGHVELKERRSAESEAVPLGEAARRIVDRARALRAELLAAADEAGAAPAP